jgi:hypothetical protein
VGSGRFEGIKRPCGSSSGHGWFSQRDQLLLKLGAAKKEAGQAYILVDIRLPKTNADFDANGWHFSLRKDRLRQRRRGEGRYLLRSNLVKTNPAALWEYYLQLTELEQAFKELKGDLAIRPIYHQTEQRIEAHIFVAFVAYCLQVTLKQRLRALAPGLTPRAVLEKFSALQMVDVHLPTTDGSHLILPRYTQPEKDLQLLLNRLNLELPIQPHRKSRLTIRPPPSGYVVPTFHARFQQNQLFNLFQTPQLRKSG